MESPKEKMRTALESRAKTTENIYNILRKSFSLFSFKKISTIILSIFFSKKRICCSFMVDLSLIVVQRNEWSMTTGQEEQKTKQFKKLLLFWQTLRLQRSLWSWEGKVLASFLLCFLLLKNIESFPQGKLFFVQRET